MEQPIRQPNLQSLGRPQCLPSFFDLWGAMEKEARYLYWRSGITRCLQCQDRSTLKQLMEEVVADVVTTKLPHFRKNANSLYGSGEVERAAMQLSKDLTLIFDTTLEEPTTLEESEVDFLNTPVEEADLPKSTSVTADTTTQWFLKVMRALTRDIDSGSSNTLPRYLGCSAGTSGRGGMEDILAPLLGLLQLSGPEIQHSIFGIAQMQGPSQSALDNLGVDELVHEDLELSETTQVQRPKRRAEVSVDAESVRKRMKRFPQSDKFPTKCPIKNCELEWKVKGRNSLIEHIEAHTQPYCCTISRECNLTFSRISNLNRHRETRHGCLLTGKQKLRTEDVIEVGEIHHRIRRFESLTQLRRLLEALGFTCGDS
ncbi:hypothetical protein BGX38DRAFT_1166261 [Terfezia claveryi]|nr:hypothetical protein BGX38DRAFT_1166261 [Terfezia claveryi]